MEALQLSKILSVKSLFREYEVNQISDLRQTLKTTLKESDFIIIDKKIIELYSAQIAPILKLKHIVIEASEDAKSYIGIQAILEELIERGFKKNHRLVAIGGGITQDITSFCASILYRGVDWIFFPTTLLAQCDSCIGSKSSINFGSYKNQLGTFNPPTQIFLYNNFAKTLSRKEIRSGLGEMMHFYFIGGREYFDFIVQHYDNVFDDLSLLHPMIKRSLTIKKSLAELDEFDKKERRIFNYGHSFGHAIESMTSFKIQHGIAVSIGMDIANWVSMQLNFISVNEYEDMHQLLIKNRTESELAQITPNGLINFLKKDKKNIDGGINVILTKGLGDMFVHQIDDHNHLDCLIQNYFKSL